MSGTYSEFPGYDDCPPDPFEHACQEAIRKLTNGEELNEADWEVISMKADAELREHDIAEQPF